MLNLFPNTDANNANREMQTLSFLYFHGAAAEIARNAGADVADIVLSAKDMPQHRGTYHANLNLPDGSFVPCLAFIWKRKQAGFMGLVVAIEDSDSVMYAAESYRDNKHLI